jgi:chemosensory pili system protein ChpA (sensor histidine kinase/response regulator)
VLHRVEDFLEVLQARAVLPSPRAIASFLLRAQADVQRQVEQSRLGYVEYSLEQIDAAIQRVSATGDASAESIASQWGRSAGISERQAASQSVDSGAVEPREAEERRHIRVETRRLDTLMNLAGELVVSRSRLTTRALLLKRLQQELKRSNRRLVDSIDRFRDDHEFTRIGAQPMATPRADTASEALPDRMQTRPFLAQFGELELDRYDDVNVLARRLAEVTSDVSELNLEIAREVNAIVEDSDTFSTFISGIQSEVTRARMIELDAVFARVRLQVRDAAERESKDVRVVARGDNVSIDKSIADALFAPLMHLVRNAVVHGIEAPDQRARLGKTAHGNVELSAREEGGQVVIQVSDDGAGLDLSALREKGAQLGLIDPGTPLGDARVKDLVFAPGLSTKAVAGAVSGRGVGGDVVRRTVERMNGSAHVASTPGRGTTFTLVLPVTLSIARALLVQQQERRFAVPLHFCERIVDALDAVLVESAGVRRLRLEEQYFPVRRLDEVLGKPPAGDAGPVLVLRVGKQRLCLQVERVLGHEEIVVKSVGDLLANHPLLAGATIRGDGELALILDVPSIIEADVGSVDASVHAGAHAVPADPRRLAAAVPLEARPVEAPREPRDGRRAEPASGEQQRGAAASAIATTRKLRVLFTDDSLSVRRVAEKALLGLGVEVTLAVDGVDAMEKLRAGGVDILFTDLEMPRMHGYELIREVRMLPAHRTLPIVVISSRSGTKHREQAMQLGASEYMTKPFSAKALDAAIERFCRSRTDTRSVEIREVT